MLDLEPYWYTYLRGVRSIRIRYRGPTDLLAAGLQVYRSCLEERPRRYS